MDQVISSLSPSKFVTFKTFKIHIFGVLVEQSKMYKVSHEKILLFLQCNTVINFIIAQI